MRTMIEAAFAFLLHTTFAFLVMLPTFFQALFLRTEDRIRKAAHAIPAQLAFVLSFRFMKLVVDAVAKLLAFRILAFRFFLCQIICTVPHVCLDPVFPMCL